MAKRRMKLPRTIHVVNHQTGKSVAVYDRRVHAMKAGLRQTRNPHMYHGRVVHKSTRYYETRRNRTDLNPARGL